MKCPKCNALNNDHHTYCYRCGNKLQDTVQPKPSAMRVVNNPQKREADRLSGTYQRKSLYTALVVIGVIVLAVFIVVLIQLA